MIPTQTVAFAALRAERTLAMKHSTTRQVFGALRSVHLAQEQFQRRRFLALGTLGILGVLTTIVTIVGGHP